MIKIMGQIQVIFHEKKTASDSKKSRSDQLPASPASSGEASKPPMIFLEEFYNLKQPQIQSLHHVSKHSLYKVTAKMENLNLKNLGLLNIDAALNKR